MIDVNTRVDPDTGDTWVVASTRVDRGEVAIYEVRVPYLDSIQTDSAKHFVAARKRAHDVLERMLDDHRRR